MKISVRWLNEYLDPANVTAEGAEHALTHAGFPIETAEELPDGDVRLDVEVTSNRGDVLSHIGVAREIAAATGRRLRLPTATSPSAATASAPTKSAPLADAASTGSADPGSADNVHAFATIDNRVPDTCPLFTARVIRGVKIGPSPEWLVRSLEAVGLRSINNVVDVTNYVALEYGQPTHVFDLRTLTGTPPAGGNGTPGLPGGRRDLIVRYAGKGEKLRLLDGRELTLVGDELVVADAARAVSLAGVMGGKATEVTAATTDVLLEAATWDPVTIRRASRRFGLRTDASHRFERIVDARTIAPAARRAAALIAELAGGRLVPGAIEAGSPAKPPTTVVLRPARVEYMLGIGVPVADITRILRALDITVAESRVAGEATLRCTIPEFRPDLEREIDLIEEVARIHGLDKLPIHERVLARVSAPQAAERAAREVSAVLTGLGFYETVTFSFVSRDAAAPFTPKGLRTVEVCDERRKAEPVLRPSAIASLLACRRKNQDAGATARGGVRLFEVSSVFAQTESQESRETRALAMIADALPAPGMKPAEARQHAVRLMRGVIEALVARVGGAGACVRIAPFTPESVPIAALDPHAAGLVSINDEPVGFIGLIDAATQRAYDLAVPVVAAQLDFAALIAGYPPASVVRPLPEFPGIERDLSLVVADAVTWADIDSLVHEARLQWHEAHEFVATFRGTQTGEGKKSVTLRIRFREPTRTLRHEEADAQVAAFVKLCSDRLGATLRA